MILDLDYVPAMATPPLRGAQRDFGFWIVFFFCLRPAHPKDGGALPPASCLKTRKLVPHPFEKRYILFFCFSLKMFCGGVRPRDSDEVDQAIDEAIALHRQNILAM